MAYALIRRLLAAAAVSLAMIGGAAAQNFDGDGIIRFGLFGGGEFYDLKAQPSGFSSSLDGAFIGFSAGYDMVFQRRMALGIEADLQVGDTRNRFAGFRTHADFLATLRGRLGFYVAPNMMLYGTAGAAWSGIGIEDSASTGGLAASDLDTNKTNIGWVAGGGLEYELRDYFGAIIFAEYLFGSFQSWDSAPGVGNIDSDVQSFRLGVKFKVGHDFTRPSSYGETLK